MKKNLNYLLSALGLSAAAIFTLSGCRDYDVMDKEKAVQISKLEEFSNNFIAEFGKPDPNHTWGFGVNADMFSQEDIAKFKASWNLDGATRADLPGGAVNTNTNQWIEDNDFALKKRTHVPGWPNDDDYYYGQNAITTNDATSNGNPIGDVTDFEIEYVSKWFRTHKDPESLSLHISDFFIQNVSKDYDREHSIVDGKEVATGSRITLWKEVESQQPNQSMQFNMNELKFRALDGSITHVNNFNNNDNEIKLSGEGQQNISKREIKYITSSGTEDFIYHSTLDNTNSATDGTKGGWFNKWVLVKLDWWETMKDGKSHHREGYYLAFDYECSYKQSDVVYNYEGDGFYTNWIVKITPGFYKSQTQEARWPKRFMTEDLGSTCDFDFNDAVFDLTFTANDNEPNVYDAVLTIHAAGGTMPIYVGVPSSKSDYEIHNLLGGNATTTPVNVGGETAEPAMYRVKKIFTDDQGYVQNTITKDPETGEITSKEPSTGTQAQALHLQGLMALAAFTMEIHIMNPKEGEYDVSGFDVSKNLRDYYKWNDDGSEIKGGSAAPQLFNCSTKAQWMKENQAISLSYEHFHNWVADEQCDWRLEWDKEHYFERGATEHEVNVVNHSQEKINSYQFPWDQNPKSGTEGHLVPLPKL